jgi:hypothetical protein
MKYISLFLARQGSEPMWEIRSAISRVRSSDKAQRKRDAAEKERCRREGWSFPWDEPHGIEVEFKQVHLLTAGGSSVNTESTGVPNG